eukprot:7717055-Pyramimonas_sp.AAC.1
MPTPRPFELRRSRGSNRSTMVGAHRTGRKESTAANRRISIDTVLKYPPCSALDLGRGGNNTQRRTCPPLRTSLSLRPLCP